MGYNDSILNRLQELAGLPPGEDSDSQLAKFLGQHGARVVYWRKAHGKKRRNPPNIPLQLIADICQRRGWDLNYIANGVTTVKLPELVNALRTYNDNAQRMLDKTDRVFKEIIEIGNFVRSVTNKAQKWGNPNNGGTIRRISIPIARQRRSGHRH